MSADQRVAQTCYIAVMATTTVRLDEDEERMLDRLAATYGGRSNALKAGLRLLDDRARRLDSLAMLVEQWNEDSSPIDEQDVATIARRYGLAP